MSAQPNKRYHEMRLEKTFPSGAEEWVCPTCGRRLVVQWEPAYKKIVLEEGDGTVMHSTSKSGVRVYSPQVCDEDDDCVISPELRTALEDALNELDWGDAQDSDPSKS